jgi:hypothetical protein
VFYILFFSAVSHKEVRFMLPIWPFLMIVTGEFMALRLQSRQPLARVFYAFLIKLYIILEVIVHVVMEFRYRRLFATRLDLA